jgi:hypothetical protein
LCYRNGAMRDLIAFTASVVYHGGVDPTVGVYGIEGSKPGAAADGWSTDIALANGFNTAMFQALSIGTYDGGKNPYNWPT